MSTEKPTSMEPHTNILSAAAILACTLPAPVRVEVPEWGGAVYVKVMMGFERDAFELACIDAQGQMRKDNFKARLACAVVCDHNGVPLFTPEQATQLGTTSAAALARIFEVAGPLNGLTKDDADALEKKA